MDKFFEKFPIKPSETVAVEMMYDLMCLAQDKHGDKDHSYMSDLGTLYEMIEIFLEEKGYSPD